MTEALGAKIESSNNDFSDIIGTRNSINFDSFPDPEINAFDADTNAISQN